MTWSALSKDPASFPFKIVHVGQADIAACERIRLEKSGNDVVMRPV